MKKRYLGLLTAFMALAAVPLFSSNPILEVGAADDYGSISVNGVTNTFGSSDYVTKFAQTVTSAGTTTNLKIKIELYKNVSASYLVNPTYKYSLIDIKLNGHEFKTTSANSYTLAALNIDGGGGTINFNNCENSNIVFYFNKNDGENVFSVKNVKMINIRADELFYVKDCSVGISTITFENCYFANCTFDDYGGILYNDEDQIRTVDCKYCTFKDISTSHHGGAFYFDNNEVDNFNLYGCIFDNVKATDGCGGAIYSNNENLIIGNKSNLQSDLNIFSNCSSNDCGGAIYINHYDQQINGCLFYKNHANYGGAVYSNQNGLHFEKCHFFENTSNKYGGALYLDGDNHQVNNSIFAFNGTGSGYYGYDIYVDNEYNSSMTGNKIYNYSSNSTYGITDSGQGFSQKTVPFSNKNNYNGSSLIRGNSPSMPIYLDTTADYYALLNNIDHENGTYKTKYLLLNGSIRGAQDLSTHTFTGQLNYGGHWIKWANYTPGKALTYSTVNHLDYYYHDIQVLMNNQVYLSYGTYSNYYTPICSLNIAYDNLGAGNYYIFEDISFTDRLKINGEVKILFTKPVTLNCTRGIRVDKNSKLTLVTNSTTNRATVIATAGDDDGAGIGGDYAALSRDDKGTTPGTGESMGTLVLENMNVEASGVHGAGIGGGAGINGNSFDRSSAAPGGDGGTLVVTNSFINVTGYNVDKQSGGRDIGGGDGGQGAVWPGGGGNGTAITMNSGEITATCRGIGGGNSGQANQTGGGVWTKPGFSMHGGNGGSIKFRGGKIISNTISGGVGLPNEGEEVDGSGAPTAMDIPDNFVVCVGKTLATFDVGQKYSNTMDSSLKNNFVKIKLYVYYQVADNVCIALYTPYGGTQQEVHADATYVVDKERKCGETEWGHYFAIFNHPDVEDYYQESHSIAGTALSHNFGMPTYSNSEDGSICTASMTCLREGCGHIETEIAQYQYVMDTKETCTTNQTGHMEAEFPEHKEFITQKTGKDSVEVPNTFTKHTIPGEISFSWNGDECTASAYCSVCDKIVTETVIGDFVAETAPKCTENRKGHYHATFTYGFGETDSLSNSAEVPGTMLGHDFEGGTKSYNWVGNKCTAISLCSRCNEKLIEEATGTFVTDVPATCTADAIGHYTCTFKNPVFAPQMSQFMSATLPGSALGHSYGGEITYYWNEITSECEASYKCQREGCDSICSEKVVGTYVKDSDPTCEENEKGHCVAIFENDDFNKGESTKPNSVEKPGTALGHIFGGDITYIWNEQTLEFEASWECQREGCDGVQSETCDGKFVADTAPTCLDDAVGHYESQFTIPDFEKQVTPTNSYTDPGSALGHEFGGEITYVWDDETHECTATWYCVHDNCTASQSETVDGVYVKDTDPKCLVNEFGHYEAYFETEGFETQYTPANSVEFPGSAIGHRFGGEVTYVWNDETHECTATWGCLRDGCDETQSETVKGVYKKDTSATCLTNEFGHYEATFTIPEFEKQVTAPNSVEVPKSALGHKFGDNVVYSWDSVTHECTAFTKCSHAGCNETVTEKVQGIYVKDLDATCTSNELGHYEATFENEYFIKQSSTNVELEGTALGHDLSIVYEWNEDHSECYATATCSRGDFTETVSATVTYEYGYAIAKFDNPTYKTQSYKLAKEQKEITLEEKNEKKVTYIFAAACGGVTAAIALGLIICIKRKVF